MAKFQKGQSGNPKGRPKKGKAFSDILNKELESYKTTIDTKDGKKITINGKVALVKALISIAFNKENPVNIRSATIERIMDRIDGKPIQSLDVDGDIRTSQISLADVIDLDKLSGSAKEEIETAMKADDE